MGEPVTPNWQVVGAVVEFDPIEVRGVNPWDHYHDWTEVGRVTVRDPLYGWQQDHLTVYEITTAGGPLRFAAGEVSYGVWLFAVEATAASDGAS